MKDYSLRKKHWLNYLFLLIYIVISDFIVRDFFDLRSFALFILIIGLLQIHKYLGLLFIAPISVISILYTPFYLNSGKLTYNSIVSFLYTNNNEALGYLKNIPYYDYLASIVLIIFTFFIFKLKYPKFPKKIGLFFIALSIILIANESHRAYRCFVKKSLSENRFYTKNIYSPIFFYNNYKFIFNRAKIDHENLKKLKNTPANFGDIKITDKFNKDVYVIVVGESVRKDFMYEYGFKNDNNTPFISNINKIKFNNYISVGPATVISLTNTLIKSDLTTIEPQNNIISLAKKLGLKTYWISNQGKDGEYNVPMSMIGETSDKVVFLKENHIDFDLLPYIKEAIEEKSNSKKLIIVHLAGSHPPGSDRTNGKYDNFYLSKDISCYIKSIKNTDLLLKNIYNTIIEKNLKFNLIYFSDHGLYLENKSYLKHSDRAKQDYQIPLFILGSDIKTQTTIQQPRSAIDFLKLFCETLGIESQTLSYKKYRFISEDKYSEDIKVLDYDLNIVNFETLSNNSIEN